MKTLTLTTATKTIKYDDLDAMLDWFDIADIALHGHVELKFDHDDNYEYANFKWLTESPEDDNLLRFMFKEFYGFATFTTEEIEMLNSDFFLYKLKF